MTSALAPATGVLRGQRHMLPVRVYYEDTDAGGVVYHANYLRYAERARTEILRAAGIDLNRLTAEENLMLPPVIAPGGMSLDEIYTMFPNLQERAASPGTRLSGGEQQMLAVARILRTGARLLLLDEISEGLAPVIVQKLAEMILTLKAKGYTIVLVEQNFRFAAPLADRFYVMEHGTIVKQFAQAELKENMGMLQEYLGV